MPGFCFLITLEGRLSKPFPFFEVAALKKGEPVQEVTSQASFRSKRQRFIYPHPPGSLHGKQKPSRHNTSIFALLSCHLISCSTLERR